MKGVLLVLALGMFGVAGCKTSEPKPGRNEQTDITYKCVSCGETKTMPWNSQGVPSHHGQKMVRQ